MHKKHELKSMNDGRDKKQWCYLKKGKELPNLHGKNTLDIQVKTPMRK